MSASGRVAVFDPPVPPVNLDIPVERIEVISPFASMHAACKSAGITAVRWPEGSYSAALVFLSRARNYSRLRIAEAAALVEPGGPVLVDGMKTDGIEALLREARDHVEVADSYVKSHGRMFWFAAGSGLEAWQIAEADWPRADGFRTAPGVFSADGVDPGSALLAAHLPPLTGKVADLGAGWGYLSAATLKSEGVRALHLVEDDDRALSAARENLPDPRAQFHWADALQWEAPEPLDSVITNPPFHTGRTADPGLGRAFIEAAARLLSRQGVLWLVANRHLPYEDSLAERFHAVRQIAAASGYKVMRAEGPRQRTQSGRRR